MIVTHTHTQRTSINTVQGRKEGGGEDMVLFPLSGARWFGREVVENPGDTRDSLQLLNHLRKNLHNRTDSGKAE